MSSNFSHAHSSLSKCFYFLQSGVYDTKYLDHIRKFHSIEDAGTAWFRGQRGGGHVDVERGVWLSASANLGWVIDHYVVVYNAIVP